MPSVTSSYTGRFRNMAGNGTEAGNRRNPAYQKESWRVLKKPAPVLQRCLAASYGFHYSGFPSNLSSRIYDASPYGGSKTFCTKRSPRLSECFALVDFNNLILSQQSIYVNNFALAIHE